MGVTKYSIVSKIFAQGSPVQSGIWSYFMAESKFPRLVIAIK